MVELARSAIVSSAISLLIIGVIPLLCIFIYAIVDVMRGTEYSAIKKKVVAIFLSIVYLIILSMTCIAFISDYINPNVLVLHATVADIRFSGRTKRVFFDNGNSYFWAYDYSFQIGETYTVYFTERSQTIVLVEVDN